MYDVCMYYATRTCSWSLLAYTRSCKHLTNGYVHPKVEVWNNFALSSYINQIFNKPCIMLSSTIVVQTQTNRIVICLRAIS